MKNMKEENPLVSIIVITYNSSKFVLETLESAKAQTYRNIELIVSDDCSTDNTVEICRQWVEENNERFARTEIITSEKNTGIAPNCNRGLRKAEGEWVKLIAGDDKLFEHAIFELVSQTKKLNSIDILFCNISINGNRNQISTEIISLLSKPKPKQYKILLKRNIFPAPGSFIKKALLNELGGFDERYPLLEDYPFLLKAMKRGADFFYLNLPLIYYRVHHDNTSLGTLSEKYHKSLYNFYKYAYLKELIKNLLFRTALYYFINMVLIKLVLSQSIKPEYYKRMFTLIYILFNFNLWIKHKFSQT